MAQLIQMRRRIKAIETIKKITHAMRLISMSMHSRLRGKAPFLKRYQQEISLLFDKVRYSYPTWTNDIVYPTTPPDHNPLIVLVASQKGLCGNFNSSLFHLFEKTFSKKQLESSSLIAVGKKAIDYLNTQDIETVVKTYPGLTSAHITKIAQNIIREITHASTIYSSVTIVSNELKTFFAQKPRAINLIPLDKHLDHDYAAELADDYIWEQNPHELLDGLVQQYLSVKVHHLLFESLLAEQAARFLSMDNSTRNAKQLLEETQLQYNKLRQAKITKELTELSASF